MLKLKKNIFGSYLPKGFSIFWDLEILDGHH